MSDEANVHWFGPQWPSPEQPAGVCEDLKLRVSFAVTTRCEGCAQRLREGDQGVRLGSAVGPPWFVYFHIRCFLAQVLGDAVAELVWAESLRQVSSGRGGG